MKRAMLVAAVLTVALSGLVLGAGTARAKTAKATFDFHAGDGSPGLAPGPDVARASNGDTVSVRASGTLDSEARTASGSGTFEHRNASGALLASGTLTVTGFTTFQFYGCGVAEGQPIPPELCGGRALLRVHLVAHPASNPSATLEADGMLEITCVVGQSVPSGAHEGI